MSTESVPGGFSPLTAWAHKPLIAKPNEFPKKPIQVDSTWQLTTTTESVYDFLFNEDQKPLRNEQKNEGVYDFLLLSRVGDERGCGTRSARAGRYLSYRDHGSVDKDKEAAG